VVTETNEAPAKGSVGSAEAALLSVKFALADSTLWAPIAGVLPIARCSSANTSPQVYACPPWSRSFVGDVASGQTAVPHRREEPASYPAHATARKPHPCGACRSPDSRPQSRYPLLTSRVRREMFPSRLTVVPHPVCRATRRLAAMTAEAGALHRDAGTATDGGTRKASGQLLAQSGCAAPFAMRLLEAPGVPTRRT
jgi:hypothetical protein